MPLDMLLGPELPHVIFLGAGSGFTETAVTVNAVDSSCKRGSVNSMLLPARCVFVLLSKPLIWGAAGTPKIKRCYEYGTRRLGDITRYSTKGHDVEKEMRLHINRILNTRILISAN